MTKTNALMIFHGLPRVATDPTDHRSVRDPIQTTDLSTGSPRQTTDRSTGSYRPQIRTGSYRSCGTTKTVYGTTNTNLNQ